MTRFLYSRYWPAAQFVLPVTALLLYLVAVGFTARLFPAIGDHWVRYALACVSVQVASLLLLTITLIASKFIGVRWNDQRRRRVNQIGGLLAEYSFGAPCEQELRTAAELHSSEFLEVWEASLANLRGSSRRRVEGLLAKMALYRQLERQLDHPDPGKVLRAIALLRKLENPPMDAIERALDHPAEVVRTAARITLGSRGSSHQQELVLNQLPRLPFWQRVVLFKQIPPESPALQDYLAGAFRTGDDTVVLAALEFVLSRQRVQPVSPSLRLVGSPNVEIRIKFFKALPVLAVNEDAISLIRLGLDDADWRVRAMAARACGVLRCAPLGPELAERFALASHPVEAGHLARALASLEGESWRRLQEFTVASDDMIRAIAAEVIEKHLACLQEGLP